MPSGPAPIKTSTGNEEPILEDETVRRLDNNALPPTLREALERVPDQDAKAMLSIALSRTTSFGFGPDPQTAKTIADAEMHEEACKLKAFEASLKSREQQGQRDHEFRKKRLNHQTVQSLVILFVIVAGVVSGLALSIRGNAALGSPILVASFTMLSGLASRLLAAKDKE